MAKSTLHTRTLNFEPGSTCCKEKLNKARTPEEIERRSRLLRTLANWMRTKKY